MAHRLDTSGLFRQLPPSAFQQGMAGVGGILEALMERRRMAARQAIEDQQKADELQFRRDQESRLIKRQEFLDEREENRLNRQDERETRSALTEAYTKNPNALPAIAQLHGGSVRQAQPNYTNENDPLGPEIPMLSDVQEDDSYLGFSYGMNPEHERRTKEAAGKRIVSIPGMQDMELQAPQAAENHFSRIKSFIAQMPDGPDKAMALRSIGQSEALGLDPHKTNEALEAARADQRMRDLAGQRRKGGGKGPVGAAKDKTDDLEVPNLDGSVAGLARTPKEAEDARKNRTIIEKAQKTADALKQHLTTVGRINIFKGNSGEQKVRDALIGSLIEARVKLTGALNIGDVDLAKQQFDTSLRANGGDAAKAVDVFMQNLLNDYEAQKTSIISRPAAGGGAKPAQAGGGDRLDAWEASRGGR